MAKANKRLRSVVEGAMEATKDARRAAAAERIRASAATPTPASPAAPAATPTPAPPAVPVPTPESSPAKPPRKKAKPKPKPQPAEVEPDTKLEATPEQRVPQPAEEPSAPAPAPAPQPTDATPRPAKPRRRPTPKPADSTSSFAPIRGPGALLGRLLKETYRQAPNIVANAVAIPAFTAAGAGGVYLGTAGTLAAIRGITKLLGPSEGEQKNPEPTSLPAQPAAPEDYRSGFQRAIDERRKPRPTDSGFDVIRGLSRPRGLS